MQTEAFLKLLRYQEAHTTYEKMPTFSLDWSNKIFGLARSAYQLMIGAQVYLAVGRLVKKLYFYGFDKFFMDDLCIWHAIL